MKHYSGLSLLLWSFLAHPAVGESLAERAANTSPTNSQTFQTILVKKGSVWRYLDNGTNPGASWAGPGFDDSKWLSGPAQLGYGDGDEATVTRPGENPAPRPITAYFRHRFEVADTSSFSKLIFRVLRDDGAAVYLNGREVFRTNLSKEIQPLTFNTLASSAISGSDENVFLTVAVEPILLVNGQNTLAVEVHQANAESSDRSFDLELIAEGKSVANDRPIVSLHATQPETIEPSPNVRIRPGVFTLTRSGDAKEALGVYLVYTGTAKPEADYEALPQLAEIPAGKTSVDLIVGPFDDEIIEGDEVVVAVLAIPINVLLRYNIDLQHREARVVIHDNEQRPEATLEITAPKDGAGFAVVAVGSTVVIEALAVDPAGFIAHLDFFANGQKIGESSLGWPECVGCEPKPGDPARHRFEWKNVARGRYEIVAKATHRLGATLAPQPLTPPLVSKTVTIGVGLVLDRNRVSIETTSPIAEESSFPLRRLPLIGEFKISRSEAWLVPLSVFVHISGSAKNGEDYESLPWLVTIPARERSTILQVKAKPDNLPEGEETVVARLSDCPPETKPPLGIPCFAADIDPNHATATVIVRDDAQTGNLARIEITAPKDGQHFPAVTVMTIEATAIDPKGYIPRVEFLADEKVIGVSEITFIRAPDPGTPIHHSIEWRGPEPGAHVLRARAIDTERNTVVSEPVHITIGSIGERVVLEIEAIDSLAAETGPDALPDPAVFLIKRVRGPADVEVPVFYSVEGSARNGIDYAELRGQILLPQGAESVKLMINPVQDKALELEETVIVQLKPPACVTIFPPLPSCYEIGERSVARAVIVDQRVPTAFERDLPATYAGGAKFTVLIRVQPPLTSSPTARQGAYAVQDQPPAGWAVARISHEGAFDTATGMVKFGPYTDGLSRTLSYEVTVPANATGLYQFRGIGSVDGVAYEITGDSSIGATSAKHPADRSPSDNRISISELTAYAAAWREGARWPEGPDPIPLSYVTRAGFLWKRGEKYRLDSAGGQPPLSWVPVEGAGVQTITKTGLGALSSAVSELPPRYAANIPFTVTIRVSPPSGVASYAVEDRPPTGWQVSQVSDGGVYDPANQIVRWGLFLDEASRTLTYQVSPPVDVQGQAAFDGTVSFEESEVPIDGQRQTLSSNASAEVRIVNIARWEEGFVQLTLTGDPGRATYDLEVSTDLVRWTRIGEFSPGNYSFFFLDSNAPQITQRFYRAVER